jgi:hypothetical protein
MNNSLSIETFDEKEPSQRVADSLKERESRLVRLIESLKALEKGREWSTLREFLFDGALETLENRLATASKKPELDLPEIYRLQGRILEARKYTNLLDTSRLELNNIRKQINPPTAGE